MKKFAIGLGVLATAQIVFLTIFLLTPRDSQHSTGARSVSVKTEEVVELPGPKTTFQRHDRTSVRLKELRGKRVVLHLWGTWCPPCVDELPRLLARADQEEEVLLAVAVDDDWDSLEKFFQDGVPTQVVVPESLGFVKELGVSGLPASLLVDEQGIVATRWGGARDWTEEEWRRFVNPR